MRASAADGGYTDFPTRSDGLSLARSFTRLRNAKLCRAILALVEAVANC